MPQPATTPIILFDGVCNLCNGFVDFVVRRDPKGRFLLGSLQSEKGKEIVGKFGSPESLSSLVLVDTEKFYEKSGAVLRVLRGLRFPWPAFAVFLIVPPFIRDAVYDWVARNRYRWFGKRDACRMPTPEERSRFL